MHQVFWFVVFLAVFFSAKVSAAFQALQLATQSPQQVEIETFYVSEKYDGVRAYWDGKHLYTRHGRRLHVPERLVSRLAEDAARR